MKFSKKRKGLALTIAILFCSYTYLSYPLRVHAAIDYNTEAEARKLFAIQSNANEDWPTGPAIGAQSAILMEANTGTILYSKNINEKLFPASTTKILTSLIATETSKMEEMVTFSSDAIHSIDWRTDANMGIKIGDKITMEQTLYGVMVGSANEAAYAIAEHISGTVEEFAKLMNQKAKELGCKNSNFVTPNGIHDPQHYTTAYDLAVIAKAYFSNELLCKLSNTYEYKVPMTATQPNDTMVVYSKNKLLAGKSYGYDSLVGSKTGYTTEARQTLVSCASKNGLTLICVIMGEESPNQYVDTVDLFDYGFNSFQAFNISLQESDYTIDNSDFFDANKDIFGSSKPILSVNAEDYIVLPNTSVFTDATSFISYEKDSDLSVARIIYEYHGVPVGSASVDITTTEDSNFAFEEGSGIELPAESKENSVIFVNIKKVVFIILGIAAAFIIIILIKAILNSYNFYSKGRKKGRKKYKRKRLVDIFNRYYD